jgi:hypothetical protein
MDSMWAFREAYNKAREIKSAQDSYCSRAIRGEWEQLGNSVFPEDLRWEALVDVLRGRTKVNNGCYLDFTYHEVSTGPRALSRGC